MQEIYESYNSKWENEEKSEEKKKILPPLSVRNCAPKTLRADRPPILSPIGSLTNLLNTPEDKNMAIPLIL